MSINLDEKIDYALKYAGYQKRWLSPEDLEVEYGFSKSTQAKMRMASNSSTIPFTKIGGKYIRYDRVAIDTWLENHRVQGA
jgi:predicted DNA-binding transcriptional regulator AlpA